MDRDGTDGTIVLVGPDLSGAPTIRERNLVQVFQAMLRPAVATEAMERALMRKATTEGPPRSRGEREYRTRAPRTHRRQEPAGPTEATAASVLWFLDDGKRVSGAVLLPDEQNAIASLPPDPVEIPGTASGKVAVVTAGSATSARRSPFGWRRRRRRSSSEAATHHWLRRTPRKPKRLAANSPQPTSS